MTTSPYTTRRVSHEEASDVARRLINGSFRRDGERFDSGLHPRFSIPAQPNHDDDCLMVAYVEQQAATRLDEHAVAEAIWLAIRDEEDRGDMELDDIRRDHPAWKAASAVVSLIARATSCVAQRSAP